MIETLRKVCETNIFKTLRQEENFTVYMLLVDLCSIMMTEFVKKNVKKPPKNKKKSLKKQINKQKNPTKTKHFGMWKVGVGIPRFK